jgi:hypothetical protein
MKNPRAALSYAAEHTFWVALEQGPEEVLPMAAQVIKKALKQQ